MYVKELFYSFQGEGPWIGYPQIFIRFYGCNIHCSYCDEPDYAKDRKNVSLSWVQDQIRPFLDKPIHSISITGGEPLLHTAAIKELAPILPFPLYLETNGLLSDKLLEVIDLFTYFSVDYKPGFEKEFSAFMEVLRGRPNVYVKYILMKDFPKKDLEFVAQFLSSFDNKVPLVLQPVTPFANVHEKATVDDVYRAFDLCSKYLTDVRVIAQTHKFIGVR